MNAITKILAITACSLPLVALAQVLPADQPRTELERKQTTETGQATKYGAPGTDTGGSMSKSGGSMSKSGGSMSKSGDSMSKSGMKPKDATKADAKTTPPVGEVPSYPAPAADGKPTK